MTPTCHNKPMRRMAWGIYPDVPTLRCPDCGRTLPDIDYVPDETDEDARFSLGARRNLIERGERV